MSTTYRAKVEHSILFMKIVNRHFERQQFFQWHPFYSFDGGPVGIKAKKALPVSLVSASG